MRGIVLEGGTFLNREQTMEQIDQGCTWKPDISARAFGDGGGLLAQAFAREESILRRDRVEAIPEAIAREIDSIIKEARRELT